MYKYFFISILLHICLLPKMLWAQEGKADTSALVWLRVAIGTIDLNAGGNIAFDYQQKNILYSFQAAHSLYQTNPKRGNLYEFSPMIGLANRSNYNRFSASVGISLVSFTSYRQVHTQDWQIIPKYTPLDTKVQYCFPVVLQAKVPLSNGCALSCALQGTYGERSFYSITLGLDLGKNLYKD